MSDTTLEDLSARQGRISDTFGVAAFVAVLGVLATWWYIQSDAPEVEQSTGSSASRVLSTPLTRVSQAGESLSERGESAFAAGDIVSPPADNALYYYQQALEQNPADETAQRGMAQVVEYLLNEAETAIYHSDYEQARDNAARVLDLEPDNGHALDINVRANRLAEVESLLNEAVALYAAGQLTKPAGENAAALYREVLELDPGNESARQGLASVVQRTVANAESAMYAGRMDQAREYLRQAKTLDPDASGVAALEQTQRNLREQQQSQQVEETLQAAAEALQADRLMPPDQPNAFTLYQQVLEADPDSESAKRGLELVRQGLLDRARTLLSSEDMSETIAHLDAAEKAGADPADIAELRDQAKYRQRLLDAKAGNFDSLYPVGELTPIRQSPPRFPRSAPSGASGSVDLQLTVTESGDVRDIEVLGNPPGYFARSARQAVDNWRFEPVMEDGQPVPVRVQVRVTFQG